MYQVLLGIQYFSILALFAESWIVFRKWNGTLHSYLFLSCVATLVNNLGYLMAMQAGSEEVYIAALKFSYFGKVWIPFALFLFAMRLCRVRVPHLIVTALGLIHAATFAMVLTLQNNKLYYVDPDFSLDGITPTLNHGNGLWHDCYMALLTFYIVFGLIQMYRAWRRETTRVGKKRLAMIFMAFLAESGAFEVYMLSYTGGYDPTVLGYTIGTAFMFVAILRYDLLDTEALARRYVIDQLSEAIIAVDDRGKVSYFNKPAQALLPELNETPERVIGRLRGAIENDEPISMGERIYMPMSNALTMDGTEIGTLYALTDDTEHYRYLTELRAQKELADNACRAKSFFLANMSHEIRTPINAILGMDEMILRESGERETLAYAEDIESAGKTLLSLINDILDLSKIEEGKMEILPAQYDLSSLINDLVNMTRPRALDKGLRFEVCVDEKTPHLLVGDEIRIRQCALNILSNAVKYTERGSVTLTVGFERTGESGVCLRFSVADTGIGMKKEDMDRLFAPFARIEETRNRGIEGTGLGMSITKQLLDLMDSRLEVESVYGEGSTFSFSVAQPVARWEPIGSFAGRYETNAPRPAYHELFHAPDARLLVVDDTQVNLTLIRGLLKKTRMQVDTAESGREALEKAEKTHYDMILLDHMMPEMDGVETLQRLRKLPDMKDVPVVALTANAISGAREKYLEAGFSDYISKPVDGMKLEEVVKRSLPPEKVLKPDTDAAEPTSVQADIGMPTVLVVDDDALICSLAARILGKTFRVETCQKGAEAAARAEALRPDLILLDINLDGLTGFDVLEALRARPATSGIPVVFLTGEKDEEAEVNGFRGGAADFVRKPFVPEVLIQRTKRIIALDRLQRGLQVEVKRQTLRAERLTKEMMLALSKTVDAKDHYTKGHSERVAAYSAELARRMGKTEREQEQIYEMGLLHDIGKIGVSEEIINKTSRLTEEEFGQIQRHTVVGSEILRLITEMPELSAGARSHHERYDGTGYPDGLGGKRIPEAARIICLADCYDAMTSTRTYSKPMEQAEVRAEITRCAGTQFDPELAEILLTMIDEDKDYIMTERTADIHVWRGSDKLWALGAPPAEAASASAQKTDAAADAGEETPAEVPDWLCEVEELNAESGLLHCGTEETWLETLKIYAKNAAANADEIETLWRKGDLANTTVKVHALKSTSRAIGADALGELAEKLELAGKGGDAETVAAGLDGLLARFRKLGAALAPLCGREAADGGGLPLITNDKLREAYDVMREFAANLDSDGAGYILNYLDGFRIPDAERARVDRLKNAIAAFDWDQVEDILL